MSSCHFKLRVHLFHVHNVTFTFEYRLVMDELIMTDTVHWSLYW